MQQFNSAPQFTRTLTASAAKASSIKQGRESTMGTILHQVSKKVVMAALALGLSLGVAGETASLTPQPPAAHAAAVAVTPIPLKPDLAVGDWSMEYSAARGWYLQFTVVNSGSAPAGAFRVNLASGRTAYIYNVSGLPAGSSRIFQTPMPDCETSGTITVDIANTVAERDETNNQTAFGLIC
jgi:hypothetical protein